ncbi:serine/threonine protein kinase [Stanieria cyanosphaera PCC 7437]|uniref:Serine/threonine protein kinase n=1 Tax=Stanieria cyanosphaera (strain ATCC 29371 / PCC 7437) TaxID=111780 RepID=K9XR05_STAC7|nr:diguanylate cyclase [Stanieria cyanosphaera]AFZ35050.1 serine/threonine protein kinase [Stanieria cyanosphaera PCC 7437]
MTSLNPFLKGYQIFDKIYEGLTTIVYRGQDLDKQKPVVIKLLKNQYPQINDLIRLRNQYIITKNLDSDSLIKTYNLEHHGRSFALVMEDFGGIPLLDYLKSKNCSNLANQNLDDFFVIAIGIAKILEQLYCDRIIHQNIIPKHILINPHNQQVKLIDFGNASLLPKEHQFKQYFPTNTDNLAYISPEQTGKMNRGLDYRTDFYSVGIIFYQLLTGQLPFHSKDLIELIHFHLARIPPPLQQINSNVPLLLNDLVLKLLAKNPEERYQTGFGLRYDLELCQQQWQANQKITNFILGTRDICDRFIIPEKVYGREAEIETLLSAFERITQGEAEIILVSGYSGVGKTVLIHEIRQQIVNRNGYFLQGKFEQFQRSIPFLGIVQAFSNLVNQLLTENFTHLQQWRIKLTEALGKNGQLILNIIPELEQIIGKQPPVVELEPNAAEKRFNLIFYKFIQVFTTSNYPLVLFIDDLQWADLSSLKLIEFLVNKPTNSGLLIIGAYRDNEVDLAHPLMLSIEAIKKCHLTQVNEIKLSPLSLAALNSLVADTLSCQKKSALSLTELIYQKTQGNPFFSIQLLQSFYQTGLITFNLNEYYWQCDLAKIKILAVSNDVVEFMVDRLKKLSIATQKTLKLAACLGSKFDLATLATICEHSCLELTQDLWEALQAELIIPVSEIYQFYLEPESQNNTFNFNKDIQFDLAVPYQFLHDRVQQAAYLLIPENERALTHLKIGNLLLKSTPLAAQEEQLFTIVNHLNLGKELIHQPLEKEQLAQLNYRAGKIAKQAPAYPAAFNYFATGIKLLSPDCWQTSYDFTLNLFIATSESAYLCGKFNRMEDLFNIILKQTDNLLDRVKVYEVKIQALIAQGKPAEAVQTALKVLNWLGLNFPVKPNKLQILSSLIKTKFNLAGKKIEDLINLPILSNAKIVASGRIMMIVGSSAYSAAVELIPLITLSGVNLSIKYGNATISTFGYAGFGIILCGVLNDIDSGYRFGKLALDLVEKLNAKEQKARTMMLFNNFIRHWKEHLQSGLEPLLTGYQVGLETGDLEFAAYSVYMHCYHSYFLGKELTELEQKMTIYGDTIKNLGQETVLRLHQVYHQVILNLLGYNNHPCLLIGKAYNEQKSLPLLLEQQHRSALFDLYFHKLMMFYLFGNYVEAFDYAKMTEKYLDSAIATPSVPIFYFYDSLARLAQYHQVAQLEKRKIINRVNHNIKKLRKWSTYSSENILHKLHLVLAEKNRIFGNNSQAIEHYDRAIKLAQEQKYLNEQALAQELAAKFYLAWGKENIAQLYFTDAYYSYARWGAKAKLEDLTHNYPQLLTPIINYTPSLPVPEQYHQSLKQLDLSTIIKAYQAISKEIKLDRLLSTLLKVILENTGTQIGYLFLKLQSSAPQLIVAAKAIDDQIEIQTLSANSNSATQQFPHRITNYVQNTLTPLVINDSQSENLLINDPYFNNYLPKSILCLPILNHHRLIAILYLENNLTTHAFTQENQTVLNILCSQAAISIENANLYQSLEVLVAQEQEKTYQLELYLQELKQTQTKLLKIQNQLKHDAFHDPLTGLPNRQWLLELLQRAINLSARYPNYLYAVLFLDLDGFKTVNDSLGHLVGDQLLKIVGKILKHCVRASDTVARFGGDEFAILLEELENPQEAIAIAQRIQAHFIEPIQLNSHQITIGISIGITFGTPDYRQPEHILQDADTAMYQAKAKGKGTYVVFQLAKEDQLSSSQIYANYPHDLKKSQISKYREN